MEPASDPPASVLERARRLGPLPYSAQGMIPPRALASPSELARWEVDAVDAWWAELGRPDPLVLADIGAGDGSRAAAFLAGGAESLTALRLVLVEQDPALREQHRTRLPIESPILVLGPVGYGDRGDEEDGGDEEQALRAVQGIGPLITSLPEPPVVEGPALVVAIGWASRLPSDRLEWRDGRWWEIRLAAGTGGTLVELPVPLDDERAVTADARLGSTPRPDGSRYAVLRPAAEWLSRTLRVAEAGRLVVIDRWTDLTLPLAPGEVPPLSVDQFAAIRRPIEATPVGLFAGLSLVSWRLG